ncbi:hypothetical protein L7F22_057046 [Adiantum nelumboides]|nr:hypothetical protein [Adiantum nelumboides]
MAPNWSQYIVDFLTTRTFPENTSRARQRSIEIETRDFTIIGDQLYKKDKDDQLRICAHEKQYLHILEQAHGGISGGHFSGDKTAKLVLTAGLWWPTLYIDAVEFVKKCDDCQRTKVPLKQDDMLLRPMMGARVFAKWGIDFVETISPLVYRTHAQYIIVATDYLTK